MITKKQVREVLVDLQLNDVLEAFDNISDAAWRDYVKEIGLYQASIQMGDNGWYKRISGRLMDFGVDVWLADRLAGIRSELISVEENEGDCI